MEILNLLRKTKLYFFLLLKYKKIVSYEELENILNVAEKVLIQKPTQLAPIIGIVTNSRRVYLEGYVYPSFSYLRYERFCKNNNLTYDFYDISSSNWMNEAKKFDIIVCHTSSTPAYQEMIESKIYILEKYLQKTCFPSYHEVWQYENKIRSFYLYQYFNLPVIPTKISFNYEETLDIIKSLRYPIISKTYIGAGSTGVTKIKKYSQAKRIVKKIFNNGLVTQFKYHRQKDYMYIQEFIEGANFDLRIIIVGNKAFGYFRYPRKGDFRASGAGIIEKKALPIDAIILACEVKRKLNMRQVGVDFLFSTKYQKFLIIETSLFNQIDTAEQLIVDNTPGYYDISDLNNICFKEGRFWVQELVLKEVVEEWFAQYK